MVLYFAKIAHNVDIVRRKKYLVKGGLSVLIEHVFLNVLDAMNGNL
jgi:hypothetical protein